MCVNGSKWCPEKGLCMKCARDQAQQRQNEQPKKQGVAFPSGTAQPKVEPPKVEQPKVEPPKVEPPRVLKVSGGSEQDEAPRKGQLLFEAYESNMAQVHQALAEQRKTPGTYLKRQKSHPYTGEACANLVKSIQLRIKDQQVALILDQLYSVLAWTGRVAVSVYTHEAQGKGDLMLGVKTVLALRHTFPSSGENKNDVVLITARAAVLKQPEVFANAGVPYVILPGGDNPEAQPLNGCPGPEHVLVAPQLAATKNLQLTAKSGWRSKSVIAMTEYSKVEPKPFGTDEPTYASGLGALELGITFDPSLLAYKKEQDALKSDAKAQRKARLLQLAELETRCGHVLAAMFPDIQKGASAVVGNFADIEGSRLYFSYSNKSASRFAMIVAEIEAEQGNDVHLVQVCPEFWNDGIELTATWLKKQLAGGEAKGRLAELGVKEVRMVEFSTRGKTDHTQTTYAIGGGKKTLHWIFLTGVPHDEMLTLIRASEPIVMMTGNQSTSEALSAGKTIFYESVGFKQSWAFCRSLYEGAGVLPKHVTAIETVSMDFNKEGKAGKPPGLKEFHEAALALVAIEQEGKLRAFSDVASASKDLGRWISGHYLRMMLLECPELAPRLLKAEEEVKANAKNAKAYEGFVSFLLSLGT